MCIRDRGGNNQPFVVETPKTLKIRSGCKGGGKGALIQDNKSATLGCNNDPVSYTHLCWIWDSDWGGLSPSTARTISGQIG